MSLCATCAHTHKHTPCLLLLSLLFLFPQLYTYSRLFKTGQDIWVADCLIIWFQMPFVRSGITQSFSLFPVLWLYLPSGLQAHMFIFLVLTAGYAYETSPLGGGLRRPYVVRIRCIRGNRLWGRV